MSWQGLNDFIARVHDRLDPPVGDARLVDGGDMDFLTPEEVAIIRPAAVLFGVIPRRDGATALLTLRPDTMSDHAGQVALPGGKVDPLDLDEVAAALREAHEEVGIAPQDVDVLGKGAAYITGTRYRITPVVGLLPHDFVPVPEPGASISTKNVTKVAVKRESSSALMREAPSLSARQRRGFPAQAVQL